MAFEQSCMIEGDCKGEGDSNQSKDSAEGFEHCFGVREDGFHYVAVFVIANGDDVDDGSEDVPTGLGLGTLDVELVGEYVEAADGGCAATGGLVLELMDIQGEVLAWPLWFGTV